MKNIILLCAVCFSSLCFSEKYIQPLKYPGQNEILINGGAVIESNKVNSITMFQTCEKFNYRKGNFHFVVMNRTDHPINLYWHNLRVTDQFGRPIPIVPKQDLIANKRRDKNWDMFFSGVKTCNDLDRARDAGRVDTYSHTSEHYGHHKHKAGSHGWKNKSEHGYNESTTTSSTYVGALSYQAEQEALREAAAREHAIEGNYQDWKHDISNFYFASTTLFPGQPYATNIQVDIPKAIEKDLQFLLFTFDMDGEEHTFCFHCYR